MDIRIATIVFTLCMSFFAQAQQQTQQEAQPSEPSGSQEGQALPEEVLIIGDRSLLQLRTQMMEAEKRAYDIFNKFNDEKRFNIHCRMHQPTGTRIQKQVCQAGFEIEATRVHAQAYYADLHDFLGPYTSPNTSQTVHIPFEVMVSSQQRDYKRKIRQVAEEHPEFLNAVIEFGEVRQRYEAATSMKK